jgi:hypothetical protein
MDNSLFLIVVAEQMTFPPGNRIQAQPFFAQSAYTTNSLVDDAFRCPFRKKIHVAA